MLTKKILQEMNIQKSVNFETVKIKSAPKYIQDIIKKLETAKNDIEMYDILDNAVKKTSDFICLNDTSFVGNGYKFQCTLTNYIKNLDKSIHFTDWELLKIIQIGNTDNAVILTKVK